MGAPMIYCTPERCALCQLIPGSDFCLRRQARRCVELSRRSFRHGTGAALREIARDLNGEAAKIERANDNASLPNEAASVSGPFRL
jgi:hypothetical protein